MLNGRARTRKMIMGTLVNLTGFIWAFAIIVVLATLLLKWKLPSWIGRSGENFVSRILHELNPKQYEVINDVMLLSHGNTAETQIDHIVVSNFGIFCVETKSYSGWIFGNAEQKQWTQVIYYYRKKFYNPMWQNFAHVKAVETIIRPSFPLLPVVGYVAFPSADRLQVSGTNRVGTAHYVLEQIRGFRNQAISDAERSKILATILAANITDTQLRKQHNRAVRSIRNSRTLSSEGLTKSQES